MIVAGSLSAALLALVLVRSKAIERPLARVVRRRGDHLQRGLRAGDVRPRHAVRPRRRGGDLRVARALAHPARRHRLPRGALAGVLAMLATASSPVAGLFLGIAAAALWLGQGGGAGDRVPPVVVVAFSAVFFPFAGLQPMGLVSLVIPVVLGAVVLLLVPTSWLYRPARRRGVRPRRAGDLDRPVPVGTNVTRLALLFGGVLLVAAVPPPGDARPPLGEPRVATVLLATAIAVSSAWQVATAARDAITAAPPEAWALDVEPLIDQLEARDAGLARVEVVPSSSHREAAALAPCINLARGGTGRPTPSATRSSTTTRPR